MKTKIIYISGSEVFDMRDIRAAFEEVRNTLNLGTDTVLFGVPVDSDDAIASVGIAPQAYSPAPDLHEYPTAQDNNKSEPVDVIPTVTDDAAPVDTPVTAEVTHDDEIVERPAPKKRGRAKKTTAPQPVVADDTPAALDAADNADTTDSSDTADSSDDAPIPILSILASQDGNDIIPDDTSDNPTDDAATTDDLDTNDAPEETYTDDEFDVIVEETEIITSEEPIDNSEKTLEELLDAISPLNEDREKEETAADAEIDDLSATSFIDETDATLEKLATEFAQNEDKIETPKSSERSKIGKLKNILPFSRKQKRDDTGLMGDLFGWAGIAANDDDFTIPGFFTTTQQKN